MGEEKRRATFEETEKLIITSWVYSRNSVYNLVGECGVGKKAEWKMENVH